MLVVVDGGGASSPRDSAAALREGFADGLDGRAVTVLQAVATPEMVLADPDQKLQSARRVPEGNLAGGGVAGDRSALGAFLREVDGRGVAAGALVMGAGHDKGVDWLRLFLSPILENGAEFVCPTYRRARLEGLVGTAMLYPLTRALYGQRLRQPAGGETAVSLELARHLLADPDWQRDPQHAGSDAWLVAKVLAQGRRVSQAWLGHWPGDPSGSGDASHALARLVGPVFLEMERHVDRWQRVEGSVPVPTVGEPGAIEDSAQVDVGKLVARFQLGLRELDAVWGLVLPPITLLALRRAAAASPEAIRIDDALWARVVYDFAVAHAMRVVERGQLLRSMTPLYLGWVAGFANEVRKLDGPASEARVEVLCAAFESEKRYLISRWRWPDSFNP